MLCSGYPNAEMTAVQLLLSNDMWEDAISLVEQTKHEVRAATLNCGDFHLSYLFLSGIYRTTTVLSFTVSCPI